MRTGLSTQVKLRLLPKERFSFPQLCEEEFKDMQLPQAKQFELADAVEALNVQPFASARSGVPSQFDA